MKNIDNVMNLSHAQRFDITVSRDTVFAPLTMGCPSMLFAIDKDVFKKTMEEKWKLFNLKKHFGKTKHHKFISQFKGSF